MVTGCLPSVTLFQTIFPFNLLLQELNYQGTLILIGPRSITPGDAQWLAYRVRTVRPDYCLRLLHSSYASITGLGERTEMRLKAETDC